LTVENLRVTYHRGGVPIPAVRGASLSLAPGESLGVAGESGSGKTTMLMIIAGLERISSGAVKIAGTDYAAMDEDKLALFRRDNIGIVFQSFHLIPTMNALENVAVPLEFAGCKDAFDIAERHLRDVGLGTATRTAQGVVTVTFTKAFADALYAAYALPIGATGGSCVVTSRATGSCVVERGDVTGSAVDADFVLIAMLRFSA
jgi:ABC-type sugar transport system ATPase subunit